jgi:hypothetical protein
MSPCTESIAARCSELQSAGSRCLATWPADPTAFCSVYSPESLQAGGCGPYHLLEVDYAEGATDLYYDGTTGQLIAEVFASENSECLGGPSGFSRPDCVPATTAVSCPDGGSGVGGSDAGGASNGGGAGFGP